MKLVLGIICFTREELDDLAGRARRGQSRSTLHGVFFGPISITPVMIAAFPMSFCCRRITTSLRRLRVIVPHLTIAVEVIPLHPQPWRAFQLHLLPVFVVPIHHGRTMTFVDMTATIHRLRYHLHCEEKIFTSRITGKAFTENTSWRAVRHDDVDACVWDRIVTRPSTRCRLVMGPGVILLVVAIEPAPGRKRPIAGSGGVRRGIKWNLWMSGMMRSQEV